jgi:archaellum component FlaC
MLFDSNFLVMLALLILQLVGIVIFYTANQATTAQLHNIDNRLSTIENNGGDGGNGGGNGTVDNSALEKLSEKVDGVSKDLQSYKSVVSDNFSSISGQYKDLSQRVDDLVASGAGGGGGNGGSGGNGSNLEPRVNVLETTLKDVGSRSLDNKNRLDGLTSRQTSSEQQLDAAFEQIRTNKQSVSNLSNQTSALTDTVGNYSGQINDANKKIANVENVANETRYQADLWNRTNGLYIDSASAFFKQQAPYTSVDDIVTVVNSMNLSSVYFFVILSDIQYTFPTDHPQYDEKTVGDVRCLVISSSNKNGAIVLLPMLTKHLDDLEFGNVKILDSYGGYYRSVKGALTIAILLPDEIRSLYDTGFLDELSKNAFYMFQVGTLLFMLEKLGTFARKDVMDYMTKNGIDIGVAPQVLLGTNYFALLYKNSIRTCDMYLATSLNDLFSSTYATGDPIKLVGIKFESPVQIRPLK